METKNYFKSIKVLRETMLSNNSLRVINSSWVWDASFVWSTPAPIKKVKDIEKEIRIKIPEDFFTFLTSISNGAILYRNKDDAMTGYQIFGTDELINIQKYWQQQLVNLWLPSFVVIGEITSEGRPIIMDLEKPTKDRRSCKLLEGNPYDPVSCWVTLSQSFHNWIDQIITSQGSQYWLWI